MVQVSAVRIELKGQLATKDGQVNGLVQELAATQAQLSEAQLQLHQVSDSTAAKGTQSRRFQLINGIYHDSRHAPTQHVIHAPSRTLHVRRRLKHRTKVCSLRAGIVVFICDASLDLCCCPRGVRSRPEGAAETAISPITWCDELVTSDVCNADELPVAYGAVQGGHSGVGGAA